jgi:hypothetical protein
LNYENIYSNLNSIGKYVKAFGAKIQVLHSDRPVMGAGRTDMPNSRGRSGK